MSDSERDEAQEDSASIGARLADALERSSDAFVALDTSWRYLYVNRHAAALFGRRPEELIGRHIWTEFPEGVGQPFHLAYEKAMREQVFVEVEAFYEPWGRWFENRIHPSPSGLSIFFHDITDRKLVEQQARDNAALLEGQNRVLELIAAGMPLGQTLDALLRMIEAQCPGMLSSILLLEADGTRVRHAAAPSLPDDFVRAIDGASIGSAAGSCGTAAYRGEAVIVEDIATDPLWDDYRELAAAAGLQACWSIPIRDADGKVLGTFACYFREPRLPDDWHRGVIDAATHTAALAIATARAADARRESEQRLRTAVEGGNVGIWECDVSTDLVVVSRQLSSMFGWPAAAGEVALQQVIDTIHPADRDRFSQALKSSIETRSLFEVEYRIICPDGAQRWLFTKAVLLCDETRRPLRTMGVTLDITRRKRAEVDISKREEQLEEAQRIARVGSYEWDVATGLLSVSRELARIFDVPHESFPSTVEEFLARVDPEDRERTRRTIEDSVRGHTAFDFEHGIVRPDGSVRLVHSQGDWKIESGKPVALTGVAHDITERRRAERQLRERELLKTRNEELQAFAYTVSHDLRAPLRGIAGYAGELRRRHTASLDARGRFCVDRILAATQNLDRLIGDLLQYARVDVEMVTRADVDLGQIVDAVLREFRPLIVERRTDVQVDLRVSKVGGWERGIRQVLTNLIDNALKYSRNADPPRVCISTERTPGGVRIYVADNGVGFDTRQRDRIFGLFNRLVTDEQFEGTGAGLAIVRKLMDKMGGTVTADSKPGSGATFILDLPDAADDRQVNGPSARVAAGEP